MFSLPCGEPSAEPRSSPANRSPGARFDLARSSSATGLDLDEQNAAYVALPRLSTVGDLMPRGFQLAGSGVGRLPVDRTTPMRDRELHAAWRRAPGFSTTRGGSDVYQWTDRSRGDGS